MSHDCAGCRPLGEHLINAALSPLVRRVHRVLCTRLQVYRIPRTWSGPLLRSLADGVRRAVWPAVEPSVCAAPCIQEGRVRLRNRRAPGLEAVVAGLLRDEPLRSHVEVVAHGIVESTLEMSTRLLQDRETVKGAYAPAAAELGLVSVQGHLGDRHHGGRTTTCLRICDDIRVVYKPRPLTGEAIFGAVAAWLDEKGFTPALKQPRVLDLGDYGWMPWVPHEGCESILDVRDYYQRLGGLLALSWRLACSDLHMENVIAHGPRPVIIDLETLGRPLIPAVDRLEPGRIASTRMVVGSILGTGLVRVPGAALDPDVSGFSGSSKSVARLPRPAVMVSPRDAVLHLGMTPRPRVKTRNQPELQGRAIEPERFARDFLQGFERAVGILARYGGELTPGRGPLASLPHMASRIVLRPTREYGSVLQEHARSLSIGEGSGSLAACTQLGAITQDGNLESTLRAWDAAALERSDIPAIYVRDDALTPSPFASTPAATTRVACEYTVRAGASGIDARAIAQQRYVLCGTYPDVAMRPRMSPGRDAPGALIACATACAEHLESLSYQCDGEVAWFTARGGASPTVGPTGHSLSSGLTGLSLFFSTLALEEHCSPWARLADAAANTVLAWLRSRQLVDGYSTIRRLAPYDLDPHSGLPGVAWGLYHVGLQRKRADLLRAARSLSGLLLSPHVGTAASARQRQAIGRLRVLADERPSTRSARERATCAESTAESLEWLSPGPRCRVQARVGSNDHSLCHGCIGALLRQAVDAAGYRARGCVVLKHGLTASARRPSECEARLLWELGQSGFRSGVPGGVEVPGLLHGVAGLGLGTLLLTRIPTQHKSTPDVHV